MSLNQSNTTTKDRQEENTEFCNRDFLPFKEFKNTYLLEFVETEEEEKSE
ncbi:MAG: hypothetical protein KDK54_19725 [Leptospiraceae bacterium]|nr:hypothetical protein [Leptospiraceae bacterium]